MDVKVSPPTPSYAHGWGLDVWGVQTKVGLLTKHCCMGDRKQYWQRKRYLVGKLRSVRNALFIRTFALPSDRNRLEAFAVMLE